MGALAVIIYVLIAILAIISVGGFIYVVKGVDKINSEKEERAKKNRKVQYTQGGIQTTPDVYTWEDTLSDIEEFSKPQVAYSLVQQLVPVFPLLGILGTVMGLIMQLNSGTLDALKDALGTSMWTTLWGLVAAIAIRLMDAFWVSKKVTELELYFNIYEQRYQMAQEKHIKDEAE